MYSWNRFVLSRCIWIETGKLHVFQSCIESSETNVLYFFQYWMVRLDCEYAERGP
jgi:hypothetical protein